MASHNIVHYSIVSMYLDTKSGVKGHQFYGLGTQSNEKKVPKVLCFLEGPSW